MKDPFYIIKFSNYVKPKVVENKSKDWVLNGKNNEFFQYVIDRTNGSPTLGAILKRKANLVYGKGLQARATNKNTAERTKLRQIIKPSTVKKLVDDVVKFGAFSAEVIQTKGGDLSSIGHLPVNCLAPSIENEDFVIENYWYSRDWSKQFQAANKPFDIPAFNGGKQAKSVYYAKPYQAGKTYFADPEFLSCLQYAEMEEEIANLFINSIKNNLSAGFIVNVQGGQNYSDEERREFRKAVKSMLTGSSNAGTFVVSFNGQDVKVEVEPMPTNENIHQQWEYLVNVSRQQIMTSNGVTSPMLFGIKDNTGLGNNANELREAAQLYTEWEAKPIQDFVTDALEDILQSFGIFLNLSFIPLSEDIVEDDEQSGVELSEKKSELYQYLHNLSEPEPEGYELHRVDYNFSDEDLELSAIQNSEQDSKLWKIRYAYNVGTSKSPKGGSRLFCLEMMTLSKLGRVYRKEDIEQMEKDGVNREFGHNKQPYSIWLFAGGVNCHHRWERRIYKKRRDEDGNPLGGNALQNTFEVNVNEARRQGAKIPQNDKDVAKAEIDKPNKGAYPG